MYHQQLTFAKIPKHRADNQAQKIISKLVCTLFKHLYLIGFDSEGQPIPQSHSHIKQRFSEFLYLYGDPIAFFGFKSHVKTKKTKNTHKKTIKHGIRSKSNAKINFFVIKIHVKYYIMLTFHQKIFFEHPAWLSVKSNVDNSEFD